MKRRVYAMLVWLLALALTASAFIPLPQPVSPRARLLAAPRAANPTLRRGDTLTIYLADAAGNVAAVRAVVEAVRIDSLFVRPLPPAVPLACCEPNSEEPVP